MDASPERKMPPEDGGRDYRNTTKGHTHTHTKLKEMPVLIRFHLTACTRDSLLTTVTSASHFQIVS